MRNIVLTSYSEPAPEYSGAVSINEPEVPAPLPVIAPVPLSVPNATVPFFVNVLLSQLLKFGGVALPACLGL
jgi:hypothetical protein